MTLLDKHSFAEHLEEFLELHGTYVQSLEDFVRHLQQLEVPLPKSHTGNKTLQKIADKAQVSECPELAQWMTGKTDLRQAVPRLDERLADDLVALSTLASQLERHFASWDRLFGKEVAAMGDGEQEALTDHLGQLSLDEASSGLAAEALDGCEREAKLVAAVHEGVTLDANADILSSQCALLRLNPYARRPVVTAVLGWLQGERPVAAESGA